MAGVSKRKKHIKKLAEKKRNKHVQIAETNIDVEDNEESLWENVRDVESNDEIIWGDDDLDRNQEDLFQSLMAQMQNHIPPTRRSTYTENSVRTKHRHCAQAKKDAEKNGQTIDHFFPIAKSDENNEISDEESEDDDLIHNSQQVINSLEAQLKEKNLDEGYKLRLTAILQYTQLLEF
jgi:hypothetical protein